MKKVVKAEAVDAAAPSSPEREKSKSSKTKVRCAKLLVLVASG